ncbi:hypothetical protein HZA87_03240 [Candidatus Uhrbacteria bacterium]|nr:hypothetical protein [Candidatus Uhrbacteria bacterium]
MTTAATRDLTFDQEMYIGISDRAHAFSKVTRIISFVCIALFCLAGITMFELFNTYPATLLAPGVCGLTALWMHIWSCNAATESRNAQIMLTLVTKEEDR